MEIIIIGTLITLATLYSRDDTRDIEQFYKDEYREEYKQRDPLDKNWWRHIKR